VRTHAFEKTFGETQGLITMTTWQQFADAAPELAAFGTQRFTTGVAYLATMKSDGAPRVHPVTPIIGQGRLFLFMEPTSPKGHDLQRGSRYALHCAVADSEGGAGEFWCSGTGTRLGDAASRAIATTASQYAPKDRYILFELSVESAALTVYAESGPKRLRWKRAA
jgi:hypothetical protein